MVSYCWLHGGVGFSGSCSSLSLGVLRYVFYITGCARDPMTHYSDT